MSAINISQFDLNSILSTYRQLYDQAFQANAQRKGEIMANIELTGQKIAGQYDAAEALLVNLGQNERTRVAQDSQREGARAEQDLISRGLSNTTIRESVKRGVNEDKNRQLQAINNDVASQKASLALSEAGAIERQGNFKSSMLESFYDQYPDTNQFASLVQQIGAAGGGTSGKSKTVIGPGSDNFGSRFRATSSGSSGGGGSSGSGVKTYNRQGLVSSGSTGVQGFGGTGAGPIQQATAGGIQSFGSTAPQLQDPLKFMGGGNTITNGGPSWTDFMQPGTGFISGENGTFSMDQSGTITQQSTGSATPPQTQQSQTYYKPGILGWSDVRYLQFASAGEAKAAGYGYMRSGSGYTRI